MGTAHTVGVAGREKANEPRTAKPVMMKPSANLDKKLAIEWAVGYAIVRQSIMM